MLRILLAAAVLTGIATLGPTPASARGERPWCAVADVGWENVVRDCSYWSFEACVPYVLAGNRGFCEPNQDWNGPVERHQRRTYRHRSRR